MSRMPSSANGTNKLTSSRRILIAVFSVYQETNHRPLGFKAVVESFTNWAIAGHWTVDTGQSTSDCCIPHQPLPSMEVCCFVWYDGEQHMCTCCGWTREHVHTAKGRRPKRWCNYLVAWIDIAILKRALEDFLYLVKGIYYMLWLNLYSGHVRAESRELQACVVWTVQYTVLVQSTAAWLVITIEED